MTPTLARERLPILQAYSEGRVVQCRYIGLPTWHDEDPDGWAVTKLLFDEEVEWRVKPTPRTYWLYRTHHSGSVEGPWYVSLVEPSPDSKDRLEVVRVQELSEGGKPTP